MMTMRPMYDSANEHADTRGLVLVVDDDARTARCLALMLRDDGYEAEVATDGAAAIARLSRAPAPDLLITDMNIPYADGTSIVHYARSRDPDLPVIVVTGHPHLALPLTELDALTVVPKPAGYDELLDHIGAAIG